MSGRGKLDFKKPQLFRKDRKLMVRIARSEMPQIKSVFKKYNVKGLQHAFDILVTSGIVFRKKEILDFVKKHKQKYKNLTIQYNLAKLKKQKTNVPDMYEVNVNMYNEDYCALKHYIVEENIKQQWLWRILFEDGLAKEEKCIVDLIIRANELKLSTRKKAIARLSNDEYITALSEPDAERILNEITTEYDQCKFEDSIEEAIQLKLKLQKTSEEDQEEIDLENDLKNKIASLKKSRARLIQHLAEPTKLDID